MFGNATPLELVYVFLLACVGIPSLAVAVSSLASLAVASLRTYRIVALTRARAAL